MRARARGLFAGTLPVVAAIAAIVAGAPPARAAGPGIIADTGNNRIRVAAAASGTFCGRAMTTGDIYTVAGNGSAGYSGDGGPATSAELRDPRGVSLGGSGNLVIVDTGNGRIREVTG